MATQNSKTRAIKKVQAVTKKGTTTYSHILECGHTEVRLKKLLGFKMVCTQCVNVEIVEPVEPVVEELEDVSTNSIKFSFTHSIPEPPFVEPVIVVEEIIEEEEEVVESPSTVHFVVATNPNNPPERVILPEDAQIEGLIIKQITTDIARVLGVHLNQVDIVLSDNSDGLVVRFAKVFLNGDDVSRIASGNVNLS